MLVRFLPLALLLPAAAGCLSPDAATLLVPPTPLGPRPPGHVVETPYAPSNKEVATRVALVGQKVLADNPQLNLQPLLRSVGVAQPEVFHEGGSAIYITEGLVNKCSDDQLAAVLSVQLAEMVAEREALTATAKREPVRDPMPLMAVGNDGGSRGPADLTQLAELAPYDRERKRAATPVPTVNPQVLAKSLLTNAKYPATALDDAQPLLKEAAKNRTIERQLTGGGPVRPWVP